MPIPSAISDLSKVASENSPAGTESVKGTIDDYLRAAFGFIRQLSDLAGGPTVTLASAATVNIGFAASANISITGTTAITEFDAIAEGALRWVTFAGALTLTHNASSLQLPGAANIVTAAGDVAAFKSLGGGNWKCMAYQRVSGSSPIPTLPLVGGAMSGSITFNNNVGLLAKDAGGTPYGLLYTGSDNNTYVTNAGAQKIIFQTRGGAQIAAMDDAGVFSPKGRVQLNNGAAIYSKDAGGTAREQLIVASDNNTYFTNVGGQNIYFNSQAGSAVATLTNAGNFTALTVTETSDERKKKAWQRLPGDFIGRLADIGKAGLFSWKRGGARGLGVGAQSLEKILPEAVHTDEKGAKTVQYGAAGLVASVELARAVVDLRARIALLEGK